MKKDKLYSIKETGFKAPNQYFETFDAKIQKRLENTDAEEGVMTSGYTVPKDYFKTFEDNLMNTLKVEEEKPVIVLKPRNTFYYIAGIAASLILLFGLIFNINNHQAIDINNIETVSLESYLYQEGYTNDELASLFVSNDISETDFININISEETLDQYLDDTDTEDLIFN